MKWYWCELCKCPCIRCDVCGNTSCNGSGCEACQIDFENAISMINSGEIAYSSDMEVIPDRMKELLSNEKMSELRKTNY